MKRHSVPLTAGLTLLLAACGPGQLAGPTMTPTHSPTPVPTSTPMATATVAPTFTPAPTATATATAVPTAAALGNAVPYGSLEITLVKVATHDLIVPGGLYYYRAKDPARIFLDLGVLVKNRDEQPTTMTWSDVALREADGTSWWPGFADINVVEPGTAYDPFRITIASEVNSGALPVVFEKDTYLRMIYVVGRNQEVVFQIGASPPISFTVPR